MPETSAQAETITPAMVRMAAMGDRHAWTRLVEIASPRVYALLLQRTRDGELAEELTQATFVRVFEKLDGYTEEGKFECWLFRLAMNLLRDEMRRRKRRAGRRVGLDQTAELPTPGPTPSDRLAQDEQASRIRAAVAQLSDADQQILHLRHTAELSFPQIAETLDQPLGTVLARGHRALKKLKRILETDPHADPTSAPEH